MTAERECHHTAAVIVPTLDRPSDIVRLVGSVLANTESHFELVVVDQSRDCATEASLNRYRHDPRLRVVRTDVAGKTRAMNLAVALTRSEFVLCTDDDCEVPKDWVRLITETFRQADDLGGVFCQVDAAPHDAALGFVPGFRVSEPRVWTSLWRGRHFGLGASMAIRRRALEEIGGFDELMGPGSPFPSADDGDVAMRLLAGGWAVLDTPSPSVVHHGFRTWDEGRELTRRDFRAIGGQCGKAVRCGVWQILPTVVVAGIYESAIKPLIRAARAGRKPEGLGRVIHFWGGFAAALRSRVDRERILFEQPERV